jgi:hypothetical protein
MLDSATDHHHGGHPDCQVGSGLDSPEGTQVPRARRGVSAPGRLKIFRRYSADSVRCCPRDRGAKNPYARTYSRQRLRIEPRPASTAQVSDHVEVQVGAVCITVGSACVGSSPTPATQHLPHPGETARSLRRRGPASGPEERSVTPSAIGLAGRGWLSRYLGSSLPFAWLMSCWRFPANPSPSCALRAPSRVSARAAGQGRPPGSGQPARRWRWR